MATQTNFQEAKEIALQFARSGGKNLMRRASAELENPFYGANISVGPVVMWPKEDQKYANAHNMASYDGRMIMGKDEWYFVKVK